MPDNFPSINSHTTFNEACRHFSASGLLIATIWQIKVAKDLGVEPQSLLTMRFEEFARHVTRLGLDKCEDGV